MSTQNDTERDTRLNVRVPENLLERLHAAARSRGLSTSGFVRQALLNEIEKIEEKEKKKGG